MSLPHDAPPGAEPAEDENALEDDNAVEDEATLEDGGAAASRPLEVGAALVACAVFGIALVLSLTLSIRTEAAPGQIDARFWPSVLSVIGLALALARLVTTLVTAPQPRGDVEARQPGGIPRVLATLVITGLFMALWSVGDVILAGYRIQLFPIAMVAFLAALLALYGARGWRPYVLFPVPLAIGTYLLFGMLLRIPL